jgi:hypothetical protein
MRIKLTDHVEISHLVKKKRKRKKNDLNKNPILNTTIVYMRFLLKSFFLFWIEFRDLQRPVNNGMTEFIPLTGKGTDDGRRAVINSFDWRKSWIIDKSALCF